MAEGPEQLDLESIDAYIRKSNGGALRLESPEAYLKRVRAAIKWSKSRAANWVAIILVLGLVGSLPLYVFAVGSINPEDSNEINIVFQKWYDVVAPLLGAVIGALFGMSIASRERDVSD